MVTTKFNRFMLAGLLMFGLCGKATAIGVPPGFEGVVAPDLEGSGVFRPAFRQSLSVEVFDRLDGLPPPDNSEFGFYFAADPSTLIPIFSDDDLSTNTLPFVAGEQARIDFFNGWVFDIEDRTYNFFSPQGRADIGFYWRQASPGGSTLFSQAILNPGGTDYAGEFRYFVNPTTWAILFGVPLGNGSTSLLGINVVTGLVPSAIPLPGAAGLWLLGLAGIALVRRRLGRPVT